MFYFDPLSSNPYKCSLYFTIISAIISNLNTPPLKKSVVGKSSAITSKKKECVSVQQVVGSRVSASVLFPPSSKSPHSPMNYLSSLSPSSMSAVSKLSSVSSKYAKDKKKLHHESTTSPLQCLVHRSRYLRPQQIQTSRKDFLSTILTILIIRSTRHRTKNWQRTKLIGSTRGNQQRMPQI